MRPPWWRPFARRRWDRAERARRDALPKTTTATLAEIYKEPIEAIVAYQYEPGAIAYYFKPRTGEQPKPDVTLAAVRIGFAGDEDE